MDPARWQQVQSLFVDALDRPEAERDGFLTSRCGHDPELRVEVESLLAASLAGESFFGGLQERVERLASDPETGTRQGPANTEGVRAAIDRAIGERYRVESLLAEGGMGLVFLAVDRKHGRRVAIKTISQEGDGALVQRFEREIRITARLQHPNILPLLDSGATSDLIYFIMPFVEGETLKARLDRIGRLPPGAAVAIAIAVAEGLSYAHGRGVLHRDIKPSNVLLADDQVQLVDFGIARAVYDPGPGERTATGMAIGTPSYMAPEQFAGQSTTRSDTYGLGAILYEALTGRGWRSDLGSGETAWEHVPADLIPIVCRALNPAPEKRWASVSELGEALRRWERHPPGGPEGAGGGLRRLWKKVVRAVRPVPERADGKSIAVLPFGNLNRDDETEYFSDGITEDIISQLSRIGELKVISRTSVMRYKESETSVARIARDLGVANVLEGSVRRVGDRIRIVSSLIDARTDTPLWTETYDRRLTDIFDIQSEIAQRIAAALRARITEGERSLIRRRPTDDVEAHDFYLKGRHLWSRRTQSALMGAEEHFEKAIARDPLFAPAYAGLADTHLLLAGYGFRQEVESLHKARAAVDRALQLDERLSEAYASRGQILRADRAWAAEEASYQRAIELNPNYATAHQWYATLLTALERPDEARREIDIAVELDPLSHAISVTSGIVRYLTGDCDGALAEFDRTLRMEPRFFSAYAWLMLLWGHLGEFERAFRAFEKVRELHGDPRLTFYGGAYLHALKGNADEALAVLNDPRGSGPDFGWAAFIHANLGDVDTAFRHLQGALEDRSWRLFVLQRSLLFYMRVGPWFDRLRADPRYDGLLRQMHFR